MKKRNPKAGTATLDRSRFTSSGLVLNLLKSRRQSWTYEELSSWTLCSVRTVRRVVAQLKRRRLVKVSKRTPGKAWTKVFVQLARA